MNNPTTQTILIRARPSSSCALQTPALRSPWTSLVQRITSFVEMRAAERAARQAIRDLSGYDDRELRDLGIPRNDISRAVRQGRAGLLA
jgi:uncharacterized protein YjiS (DUF1127 family)